MLTKTSLGGVKVLCKGKKRHFFTAVFKKYLCQPNIWLGSLKNKRFT